MNIPTTYTCRTTLTADFVSKMNAKYTDPIDGLSHRRNLHWQVLVLGKNGIIQFDVIPVPEANNFKGPQNIHEKQTVVMYVQEMLRK